MTRRALLTALPFVLLAAARPRAQRTPATIYKDPSCGCCTKWAELLRQSGFDVTIRSITEIDLAKYSVPPALHSCHTAVIDGYIVEGHVPVADVRRMLKEGRGLAGLAVPGMPIGSPGMEVAGVKPQAYNVIAFDKAGKTRVFATYRG